MTKAKLLLLLAAAWPASPAAVELSNRALAVRLDPDAHGSVTAIIDRVSSRNFVAGPGLPLYTITLVDRQGRQVTLRPDSAVSVKPVRASDGSLELTFEHRDPPLTVNVGVRVPREGTLSYWRLDARNRSAMAVTTVAFPGFAVAQSLGPKPGETELIMPHANNSQRYWNLPEEFAYVWRERQGKTGPIRWPLGLCGGDAPDILQMMALYDRTAGLYMATNDRTAEVKSFAVEGLDAGRMQMRVTHSRPRLFGQDFTMGYETIAGVFHGDWTAAADIYREWAERQPWCAKGKLGKRDTPEWLTRYPVYLRYVLSHPGTKGSASRTKWSDVPARVEQFRREYPDLFPDAIMHFVDFDTGGFWQGYYNERWPAWMGDDVFAAEIRRLKGLGLHPAIEPFIWLISFGREDRPGYDARKQPWWPDLAAHKLVWTEDHDKAGTKGGGLRPFICLATPYGQTVFRDDVARTAPWGMDMLQAMEINLTGKMNCFNTAHGHPPGAGRWVFEDAYTALRQAREKGRAINPDITFDKEETAEFLIPVLDSMYVRNAQMKNMRWNGRPQLYRNNVPLFDYVYHQYIELLDGFQANSPESLRWCAANAAVLGHMTGPLFNGDPASALFRDAAQGGAWRIVQTAKKAYNSYARRYVTFGRVLPAPGVAFEEMEQPAQAMFTAQQPGRGRTIRTAFRTPKVLQSAHQAPEGGVGLSFINICDDAVRFKLDPSRYARYLGKRRAAITIRQDGEIVRRLTAALSAPLDVPVKPLSLVFITLE